MAQAGTKPLPRFVRGRLTRAGWLFVVVAGLIGAATLVSPAALGYVIFGIMIGAVLGSILLSRRMLGGLEVRRDAPRRVWQNQTVHIGYYIRNRRRSVAALGIALREEGCDQIESAQGYCASLRPGQSYLVAARVLARKRGRGGLRTVRAQTEFPFGLFLASRRIHLQTPLIVWPARGRLTRRILYSGAAESSTSAPSQASGGQDEFFGLREYRAGDNPRWIHWRRSASRPAPVVREMCRPLPDTLMLVLDTYLHQVTDEAVRQRERLIRFAATLIDHAFSCAYQVGLATAHSDAVRLSPPNRGQAHMHRLLDTLAETDDNRRWRLEDILQALPRRGARQLEMVVITPAKQRAGPAAMKHLRSGERYFTLVTDARLDSIYQDNPLAAGGGL